MKPSLAVLLLFVILATVASAQETKVIPAVREGKGAAVVHYVATHKRLLLVDAVYIGGEVADAWSSTRCQAAGARFNPPACTETDPLLGKHPGPGATWGSAMGLAAAFTVGNHLVWHLAGEEDPSARNILFLPASVFAVFQAHNVLDTVNLAQGLDNRRARARARLLRSR